MRIIRFLVNPLFGLVLSVLGAQALAADFVVPVSGRVTIELLSADSAFTDTLSVSVVPPQQVAIAISGCTLAPATGFSGLRLLSGMLSRVGCRVELDSDPLTPGIQGFPAGTVLHFNMCAEAGADPNCTYIWSSTPAQNADGTEHVRTISGGNTSVLQWEDLPHAISDNDFNDLVVAVRVNVDSDGDGLWDDWEQSGIDLNGDGVADVLLPGADPKHKDIFVRLDYMDCAVPGSDCAPGDTHSHRPLQSAIDAVVQAFAGAPLLNPDGTTGIRLHVEIGNAVAHQKFLNIPGLCFPGGPGIGNFDTVKTANFAPTDPRRLFTHYGLFSHQQAPDSTSSGCAETPGNDFQVSLGGWNVGFGDIDGDGIIDDDVGSVSQQAGTLMHELGHNLGLRHGGDEDVNYKPNYLSVMNYSFQIDGIPTNQPLPFGPLYGRMDYSRGVLTPLNELGLLEFAGLGAGLDNTFYFCPDTFFAVGPGTGPIDWNCNGIIERTPITADVNLDGLCVWPGVNGVLDTIPAGDDQKLFGFVIVDGRNRVCETQAAPGDEQFSPVGQIHPSILHGYSDWPNLKYDFQNTRDFEDGMHTAPDEPGELTYELYLKRSAADLIVTKTAGPNPVVAGSNITYQINLGNRGAPPARNIVVTDILPAATTFVSCSSTGGGVCAGAGNNRTVSLPALAGGASATVTLVAQANCTSADGTVINNSASATTTTQERTLVNNVADASVTINQAPPPTITGMSASPSTLWPANKKLIDVAIDYQVSGNCGPMSCTLKVSSDPEYDDDDEHHCHEHHHHHHHHHKHHCDYHETDPNWIVVDAHHVKLRAEHADHHQDRTYKVTAVCTNSLGATVKQHVKVKVPHKKPE